MKNKYVLKRALSAETKLEKFTKKYSFAKNELENFYVNLVFSVCGDFYNF